MKAKFIKSAALPADYPFPYKPEVAVVGRSNAGKSSFINALIGQRMAKVSATPGKTRLLNFFELLDQVYLVDCPGYGFAKGSLDEALGWREMMETYFAERKSLKGVIVVMDIRRDWDDEETLIRDWFAHHKVPWVLLLNKADKLSRSAGMQRTALIRKHAGEGRVFMLSSLKKTGFDEVKNILFKEWGK